MDTILRPCFFPKIFALDIFWQQSSRIFHASWFHANWKYLRIHFYHDTSILKHIRIKTNTCGKKNYLCSHKEPWMKSSCLTHSRGNTRRRQWKSQVRNLKIHPYKPGFWTLVTQENHLVNCSKTLMLGSHKNKIIIFGSRLIKPRTDNLAKMIVSTWHPALILTGQLPGLSVFKYFEYHF